MLYVTQHALDQRTITYERDDDAIRELERRQPAWLAGEIALARLFVRIDRKAAYIPSGCASVEELAARKGYDGFRVRELLRLGYALEGEPALEDAVRKGEITFQAGCEIGRIYRDPELIDDKDD